MQDKLKCAVIGVGNMGKNHVRSYNEIADVDLVAISDVNENLGEEISKFYNIKYYKDYKTMIENENIDIISICVPTFLHYEVAKNCIDKNINILLEKPITSDTEQAKKLLQLAKEKNIKFLVGHIERYNPAVKMVKKMIDKGDFGQIITIMARRVGGFPQQIKDADIAVDLAIHDIDIINYLLSDLPMEISINKQRNHIEKREDSVEFFLKYQRTSAFIQANWMTPLKIRKLNITGTEGYVEMDYISQKIEFYKSNYEKFREIHKDFSDYILRFSEPDIININVAKKEPLKEEILYLIYCIKNNIIINCNYAVDALQIALQ